MDEQWNGDMNRIRGLLVILAVTILSLATGFQPSAQTSEESTLVCGQYEDDTERLKCLNQLLDMLMRARGGEPIPELGNVNRPASTSSGTAPAPATPSARAPTGDTFGLPAAQTDTEADKRRNVRIVASKEDVTGIYYFMTADGQVWRQTVRSRFTVPKGEFDAEIRKGSFGGFQLRVADVAGFLRVQRLK